MLVNDTKNSIHTENLYRLDEKTACPKCHGMLLFYNGLYDSFYKCFDCRQKYILVERTTMAGMKSLYKATNLFTKEWRA